MGVRILLFLWCFSLKQISDTEAQTLPVDNATENNESSLCPEEVRRLVCNHSLPCNEGFSQVRNTTVCEEQCPPGTGKLTFVCECAIVVISTTTPDTSKISPISATVKETTVTTDHTTGTSSKAVAMSTSNNSETTYSSQTTEDAAETSPVVTGSASTGTSATTVRYSICLDCRDYPRLCPTPIPTPTPLPSWVIPVAGAGGGALLILIVIVVVVVVCVKKRRSTPAQSTTRRNTKNIAPSKEEIIEAESGKDGCEHQCNTSVTNSAHPIYNNIERQGQLPMGIQNQHEKITRYTPDPTEAIKRLENKSFHTHTATETDNRPRNRSEWQNAPAASQYAPANEERNEVGIDDQIYGNEDGGAPEKNVYGNEGGRAAEEYIYGNEGGRAVEEDEIYGNEEVMLSTLSLARNMPIEDSDESSDPLYVNQSELKALAQHNQPTTGQQRIINNTETNTNQSESKVGDSVSNVGLMRDGTVDQSETLDPKGCNTSFPQDDQEIYANTDDHIVAVENPVFGDNDDYMNRIELQKILQSKRK